MLGNTVQQYVQKESEMIVNIQLTAVVFFVIGVLMVVVARDADVRLWYKIIVNICCVGSSLVLIVTTLIWIWSK